MTMTALDLSPDITSPPTDLWSDEPQWESDFHLTQLIIFIDGLNFLWRDRNDYYASGNLTIYYKESQLTQKDLPGPDFFVVLNVEKRPRKSWVVWGEGGKYPDVIIEILADETANIDRTLKKDLYQNIFRTPNYFWFDPESLEFQGFTLQGSQYQAISPDERGYLWSEELGLYLGIFEGKLRYFTKSGELVPTPEEFAVLQGERSNRLARKLREIGIDPDTI
jgi:Uma2 family endonuclease